MKSNLIHLRKAQSLEDKLPIWKIEQDLLISKTGDITLAYELILPEIYSLSEKDYLAIQLAYTKGISNLPAHSLVHKQDWYLAEQFKAKNDPNGSFLSRASERHFNERIYFKHKSYLFITKYPKRKSKPHALSSSLLRNQSRIVPKELLDQNQVNDFLDKADQFAQILASAGIAYERLRADDLAGTLGSSGLLERYLSLGTDGLLRDINFSPKTETGLSIGEKHVQVYSISHTDQLPSSVQATASFSPFSTESTRFPISSASPLGMLLPFEHIYNHYTFICDKKQILKSFEARKKNLQSLSQFSRENALNREWHISYLNEATAGKLPVRMHANVLVWTEHPKHLAQIRNLTSSAVTQLNVKPRQHRVDASLLFWAGIPGNGADLPREDTFYTFPEQASSFIVWETNARSNSSAFGLYLIERRYGIPVWVDLSDSPMEKGIITNRNKFILGPSGSGKSFFTNHLLRNYWEQKSHIVIVDVGDSYERLCELAGGVYFKFREDDPISFNPFYLPGGEKPDVEKKESIKALLSTLWKKENESLSRSEENSISTAISQYYKYLEANGQVFPSFNTFYEFTREDFAAYLKNKGVREREFDLANFLYVLEPFYKGGQYDYLLNSKDLKYLSLVEESFIVFELDNIKDHPILFPVTTIIIMELYISKMRKLKGIRKIIALEEAWKAISKAGMAEYIKYLYKTVRKHYGEVWTITQEVEDIVSSAIVKNSIINNADCKILLDQSKYAGRFDEVSQLLGLSEEQKAQILSINKNRDSERKYKDVYIGLGTQFSRVYSVEVSREEYFCYTTEQKEKQMIDHLKKEKGLDLATAISQTARAN